MSRLHGILKSTVSETEERYRGVAFQNNRQRGSLRNYDSQENVYLGLRKVVQKPMANEKVPALPLSEECAMSRRGRAQVNLSEPLTTII